MDNDAKAKRYDAAVTGLQSLINNAKAIEREATDAITAAKQRIEATRPVRYELEKLLDDLRREPERKVAPWCVKCHRPPGEWAGCRNEGCEHNGTA